jgi:hypothetical protein
MTSAGGSSNGRQPVRPAASRQSPPCAELHLGATFATVPTRGTTERFRGPGFASQMQFALCDWYVERAQCHAPTELPRSVTFVRAPTPGAPPRLGRNRLSRARSHREQQPTGCSWRILSRGILRARPARAGHFPVKTPPKDRFQSADSPGQIFVQSLHAGFALLSFRGNAGGVRHGSPLIETIEDRPKRC